MVYSLLYDLPVDRQYEVIFMRRELNEILASQSQMLQNMNIVSGVDDSRMAKLFEREIARFQQWLSTASHINSVEVLYNDVASGSGHPINSINEHLGGTLNVAAMLSVVDPSLYRNRAAASTAA